MKPQYEITHSGERRWFWPHWLRPPEWGSTSRRRRPSRSYCWGTSCPWRERERHTQAKNIGSLPRGGSHLEDFAAALIPSELQALTHTHTHTPTAESTSQGDSQHVRRIEGEVSRSGTPRHYGDPGNRTGNSPVTSQLALSPELLSPGKIEANLPIY